MASKIKGTSTADLLNMGVDQLNKMTESQLRQAVSRMADAANKRIYRIMGSGVASPATEARFRSGSGFFTTKGKDLNALRNEYANIKQYMESATGSVRGSVKVENQVIESLKQHNINITRDQYSDFWRSYEKLKEIDSSIGIKQLKYKVLENVAAEMDGEPKTIDEIVKNISGRITQIYEQAQEDDEFSEFIELS